MSSDLRPRLEARPGIISSRRLDLAWKATVAVGGAILAWGAFAAVSPEILTPGFEAYADISWQEYVSAHELQAGFTIVGFRLIGALNVALAINLIVISAIPFRRGEAWAWWLLLVGNTLAIGFPIVYDRVVGYVGVFELLEYVALGAVYLALGSTIGMVRTSGRKPSSFRGGRS